MTASMLSAIETGERMPSLQALRTLALYYGLSMDDLCGLPKHGKEESPRNAYGLMCDLVGLCEKWKSAGLEVQSKQLILSFPNCVTYAERVDGTTIVHTLVEFFKDYQGLLGLKRQGIISPAVVDNFVKGELDKAKAFGFESNTSSALLSPDREVIEE